MDPLSVRVAVADSRWRILAANDVWLEGARNYGVEDYLGIGKSYARFSEAFAMEAGDLGSELLLAIRSIDEGRQTEFTRDYELATGQSGQVSIAVCEAQGQRFLVISYFDTDDLVCQRERGVLFGMLQSIEMRVAQAQEHERRRVAREFHDSAAQHLTGVSLALSHLGEIGCSPQVRTITQEISLLLEDFHRDLRGLAYALHPPEIEQSGFCGATLEFCNGLARRTGLDIQLGFHGPRRLPLSSAETAIYRIMQEALNNVHRHARATQVCVRVCERRDRLLLAISDNGVGLKERAGMSGPELHNLGVGIPGMIARATELGGRCVVRNRHGGSGTFVGAAIPHLAVASVLATGTA
ncbi:sensor histidine kinase [Sphingobium sp.]|uniref:sensor histidine kinase n=1 Tax=Sphingobium sp. TaxID=1912891 RepID=UPI002ED3C7FB